MKNEKIYKFFGIIACINIPILMIYFLINNFNQREKDLKLISIGVKYIKILIICTITIITIITLSILIK